ADTVSARIRSEGIVGKTQFEVLAHAEFEQTVDVLVRSCGIQTPFGFEHSGLYRLRGSRDGWTVRDWSDLGLRVYLGRKCKSHQRNDPAMNRVPAEQQHLAIESHH